MFWKCVYSVREQRHAVEEESVEAWPAKRKPCQLHQKSQQTQGKTGLEGSKFCLYQNDLQNDHNKPKVRQVL